MNYKLFNAVSFAVGAVIGSAVTWKLLKSKYEQIAQEEIDDVKEHYKKKLEDRVYSVETHVDANTMNLSHEKPDILEYAEKIKELNYSGEEYQSDNKDFVEKEDDSMEGKPYVISEEEFDDAGYDTETLTYFADGVLTDWYNDPIEEPEDMVGEDTLERFDELADGDTVFVRNPNHMTDYEIQRDHRNYVDVYPGPRE